MAHIDDARVADLIARSGDGDARDLFGELLETALQELIDGELTAVIGAEPEERTATRSNWRSGGRPRVLSTSAGDVSVRIPKVGVGSFFLSLLEPRRRGDEALWAVIMTAYVTRTSTRKVDDLVRARGCDSGVSKSTVSRSCGEIDTEVGAFRTCRLDHQSFPYAYLDATYVKARRDHQTVSRAVVATGVDVDGNREVLGVDVGGSEDEVFWTAFLRSLRDRGLGGGAWSSPTPMPAASGRYRVFAGASTQRCKVHFMGNLLARVPASQREMVAALVRSIYTQPDATATRDQLHHVADTLTGGWPDAADLLTDAEADRCGRSLAPHHRLAPSP